MVTATYDSRCGLCDGMIEEGEPIGRVDGEWCCEDCIAESGRVRDSAGES